MALEAVKEILCKEEEGENVVKAAKEEARIKVLKAKKEAETSISEARNEALVEKNKTIEDYENAAREQVAKNREKYELKINAVKASSYEKLDKAVTLIVERIVKNHGNS